MNPYLYFLSLILILTLLLCLLGYVKRWDARLLLADARRRRRS